MENKLKVNSLAIVSFISGIIVLFSLGLYYALSQIFLRNLDLFSLEILNRVPLVLMELSVPFRNIFAPLAVVTGVFGLREIKKNPQTQKGKSLAWIGMLFGGGWIILGILVSITYLLAKVLQ